MLKACSEEKIQGVPCGGPPPPRALPVSFQLDVDLLLSVATLLRRGSTARAAADGPRILKPDRKRKGNLCQNDYDLTCTLCVLTYISLYL